jgi:hypothetical protein
MLIDFQGHILDLAGSVIISFTRNTPATANQAVCSMFVKLIIINIGSTVGFSVNRSRHF